MKFPAPSECITVFAAALFFGMTAQARPGPARALDCRALPVGDPESDDRLIGTWSDAETTIEIAHESGFLFSVEIDGEPVGLWEKNTDRIWSGSPIPPYPYNGAVNASSDCSSYSDPPSDAIGVGLHDPHVVDVDEYRSPATLLYLYREVRKSDGAFLSLRLRYFRRMLDANDVAYAVAIDKMLAKQ